VVVVIAVVDALHVALAVAPVTVGVALGLLLRRWSP